MNFLNRRNNILYHFSILLSIRKPNFLRSNNLIIYYNKVVFLKTVLRLILIVKKPFIAIISRKRLMKKMTLRK